MAQVKAFKLIYALTCVLLLSAAANAGAANFTVNTTDDHDDGFCSSPSSLPPGDCTLREAINAANLSSGADTITFNIPTTDPGYSSTTQWWTIRLALRNLPMLVDDGTTIDGFSQPGSLGTFSTARPGVVESPTPACAVLSFERPNIVIDANKAALPSLTYPSPSNADVMSIAGTASDIRIKGMAIYDGFGVPLASIGAAVGAHAGPGLRRYVESMFIGVLPDGTQPPAAERNLAFGIEQYSASDGSQVGYLTATGNYVGYNGLGGINGQEPVSVIDIRNNESFQNGWGSDSHDGLDVNGYYSVVRCNLSHDNQVVGIPNGGGGNGIEVGSTLGDSDLDNNLIEYNSSYNNMAGAGVSIRKGPRGNLIRKNVFHHNLVGIDVNREGRTPTNRNQFSNNSTYMNVTLGIDLQGAEIIPDLADPPSGLVQADTTTWLMAPDNVTPNDSCDLDGTPPGTDGDPTNNRSNDLQNFPDLTSADLLGSQIFMRGSLESWPQRDYVIQFFATPGGNVVDREGQYFLGQIVVHTDSGCRADFYQSFTPAGPVAPGDVITATATRLFHDANDVNDWWSTSEYSEPQLVDRIEPTGKVTGGGYIQPATVTCLAPCTSAADTRANFGFVAQYKNNTDTDPQGHINFVWNPGGIHFGSTDYLDGSLIVVRDPANGNGTARWQGEGKLDNQTGYCFKANVHDNGEPGSADSFRIKIWRKIDTNCATEGAPIYDNGSDTLETTITGGNIQIHHP